MKTLKDIVEDFALYVTKIQVYIEGIKFFLEQEGDYPEVVEKVVCKEPRWIENDFDR